MVTTERIIEHMCEKDRSRGRVREKGKTRRGGGGGEQASRSKSDCGHKGARSFYSLTHHNRNVRCDRQDLWSINDLLLEFWPRQVDHVGNDGVNDKLGIGAELVTGEGGDAINQEFRRLLDITLEHEG